MAGKKKIRLGDLSISELLELEKAIAIEKDERIEILQGRRRTAQDLNIPPAKPTV